MQFASIIKTELYGFSDDNNQGLVSVNDNNQGLVSVNDDRQASAKGLDDNGSIGIALEKSGIIDLDEADYKRKLDKYIEVVKVASNKFEEKAQGRDTYRKDAERFTRDLVSNFEQVVDLVIEVESIGIKDDTILDSLSENSDNTKEVNEIQKEAQNLGIRDKESLAAVFRNADKTNELKEVINVAAEIGVKDKENLHAVFKNADKAVEFKEVLDVARETLGEDDGLGGKKLDSSKASILSSTLKNADKAAELKSVLAIAKDLDVQDAEHLTSVFVNADMARDLITVCYAAVDTFGEVDGTGLKKLSPNNAPILSSTLKNADKASQLKQIMEVSIERGLNDAKI